MFIVTFSNLSDIPETIRLDGKESLNN